MREVTDFATDGSSEANYSGGSDQYSIYQMSWIRLQN